ncbi:MAG: hypothetical protein HYY01_10600 [Chloroflexi bacterium]|nr:hypothetical protein [Chloroflexota bacterium]
MEKRPEEQIKERVQRVEAAVALKVPDRVPLVLSFGLFPAKYGGISCEDAFYDPVRWGAALKKAVSDFAPDMYEGVRMVPGPVLEALDCKQVKWPGHGAPSDHSHQFVEGEYMKADEYSALLDDPTDYALRVYMPRVYGSLEGLRTLRSLRSWLFGYMVAPQAALFTRPEVTGALEALIEAGHRASRWRAGIRTLEKDMAEAGFPQFTVSSTYAPFDIISDTLRGMRGTMLDMYRQPDKLIEACERLLPVLIETGVGIAKHVGNPRVFIPLHRGADGFMSVKQYETFYWPTFKRLLLALCDQGLTPCPFFEGDYTSRLEYLRELPKGKVLCHFDRTDLVKAKEVLGDHLCVMGNVPASLLQLGSPQEVREYCQKLVDRVGKGGGFIMAPGCVIDEARPENVKAMCDFTREYGVYA